MRPLSLGLAVLTAGVASACSLHGPATGGEDPFADLPPLGAEDHKGDMLSQAVLVRDIELDSTITGRFDRRKRVYGFTVEAKTGAVLTVRHTALAAGDSYDVDAGQPLDTVVAFYGPIGADGSRGERLAAADDAAEVVNAPLPSVTIPEDGTYLFVLSSWDDTGSAEYAIDVRCAGTDFQCRRPLVHAVCRPGTEYIVGGGPVGTATWDRCTYVLLEHTRVAAGEILTIEPGVTVKGNFLGSAPYGTVGLEVLGTLQAAGTAEHPVFFTSVGTGWQGITLAGANSSIEYAFVEKAAVGVRMNGQNNAIRHSDINSSADALHLGDGSAGTTIESTILRGVGSGRGIYGRNARSSTFHRALVTGFADGIQLDASELVMSDSTIAQNARGVTITGPNAGVNPPYECPPVPTGSTPPPYSPPRHTTWTGWDPAFYRVDIIGNTEHGIRIDAPELLIVEDCNLIGNGVGLAVASNTLHPDSRIRHSNLYGATASDVQVDVQHTHGALDISGNYWAQISDPQLSASWRTTHTSRVTCTGTASSVVGDGWSCSYQSYHNYRCSREHTTRWSSPVLFTGFVPEELRETGPAGPLTPEVNRLRAELGLEAR